VRVPGSRCRKTARGHGRGRTVPGVGVGFTGGGPGRDRVGRSRRLTRSFARRGGILPEMSRGSVLPSGSPCQGVEVHAMLEQQSDLSNQIQTRKLRMWPAHSVITGDYTVIGDSMDHKDPPRPVPFIADGSEHDAMNFAIREQHRRTNYGAKVFGVPAPPVPPLAQVLASAEASDAAIIAHYETMRRQFQRSTARFFQPVFVPEDELPVPPTDLPTLLSLVVVRPYKKTAEGQLVSAVTIPLMTIVKAILENPSVMFEFSPRRWEAFVAATYDASGLFDEVTLTPSSGDSGQDVIAVKKGFGSVRIIESVKRYRPKHKVTAKDVREIVGVISSDRQASKGVISTTWQFAPRIKNDPLIKPLLPTRLELVNGEALIERIKQYTRTTGK
jgi:restriction system protein